MLGKKTIKIAIVEDDFFYNKSLSKYVNTICNPEIYKNLTFEIKSFTKAADAIEELEDDLDIMILDYFLFDPESTENLNGEHVLIEVNKHCEDCKVILISGRMDATTTVNMLKNGISEFIDKKVSSKNRLGAIIQQTLQQKLRA